MTEPRIALISATPLAIAPATAAITAALPAATVWNLLDDRLLADAQTEGGENTEGMSRETVTRTPEPLDTEDVTLYLFAIDGIMIH